MRYKGVFRSENIYPIRIVHKFSKLVAYFYFRTASHDNNKCIERDKMIKPGFFIHINCRNATYAKSKIERFHVPDNLVLWSENFPDYRPIFYESPVLSGKPWADEPKGILNCSKDVKIAVVFDFSFVFRRKHW